MTLNEVSKKVKKYNETDKERFIVEISPYAEEAASELGIDPNVLIAQAGHETGWGKHVAKNADGTSSNNLFNIKTTKGWQGSSTTITTHEIEGGKSVKQKASFRSYSSYKESFQDYTKFIKENKRYSKAIDSGSKGDSYGYIKELAKAGYATDTSYSSKVLRTAAGIGSGVLIGAGVIKSQKTIAESLSKGISKTTSTIGKIPEYIKGIFSDKEDVKKETKKEQESEGLAIVVPKGKTKIAYETSGLSEWHKKIIIALTDWANSKRTSNNENKNDRISVNQALNEKTETETIKIEGGSRQSKAPIITFGSSLLLSMPIIYDIVAPTAIKQRSNKYNINKEVIEPQKNKISIKNNDVKQQEAIKQTAIIKTNPQEVIKQADDIAPIQERFTKYVNDVAEKIEKQNKSVIALPNPPTINPNKIEKYIPKEISKENKQKVIIVEETNSTEILDNQKPILLFGDKYSANEDIRKIFLGTREFGTGLLRKRI